MTLQENYALEDLDTAISEGNSFALSRALKNLYSDCHWTISDTLSAAEDAGVTPEQLYESLPSAIWSL